MEDKIDDLLILRNKNGKLELAGTFFQRKVTEDEAGLVLGYLDIIKDKVIKNIK